MTATGITDALDGGMLDDGSFDDFFRREQPRTVALAYRLTGQREVARDLAQDSMLKAFQWWSSVREMDRPGAWVRRVTINAAMSWHRSDRRRAALRQRLAPATVDAPAEPEVALWEQVRRLPPRQREAVLLYYVEDMSVADAAERMAVAVGTVKAALARARAGLGDALIDPIDGRVDHRIDGRR